MKKVHIREAINTGWSDFKRRPWYLLGLTVATFALMTIISSDSAAVITLAYILFGGYIAVLLKHADGEAIVFDDLFDIVDKRWIYFAFMGVIKMVLITLGMFLLVVPGIYMAIRWTFSELLVLDKGLRPLEALRASSDLTEGVRWKMFLFLIPAGLVVGLSIAAMIASVWNLLQDSGVVIDTVSVVAVPLALVIMVVTTVVYQLAVIKVYKDVQSAVSGKKKKSKK